MMTARPLLLAAALCLIACGSPVEPRSAVQNDAIAKSDLEGTWYFRQTVIGVPFATGFTFPGEQGENELEKIVWDLQEEVLTARRTYEFVRGSEKGVPGLTAGADAGYRGAPVAAFKVTSHFDIIREYNPATGEEYDKFIESQERKWFERKFVRVDWSQNLVTNFNFLADYSSGSVEQIKQDPVPYYVSDPADPDALRLERPASDQPADYLEVTQKLVASPEAVTFEDGTRWPLCFLEYATSDCASQELRIRNSFLRVKESQAEPMVYSDKDMERFGYFSTERKSYNRQYGLTESGRVRLINRHNLWQQAVSAQECKVDADCGAPLPGVRCVTEVADAKVEPLTAAITGRCALPYTARNLVDPSNPSSADLGPRRVVYHLNLGFPEDLKPAALELERQYDAIFKGLIEPLQGRPVTGKAFIVCLNNPVRDGDPSECGPPGTSARIGDLRFNMLFWVDEPVSAGLLGYGPSSNDPQTGETISSTAFVYGAQIDTYAAYARDLVRLQNGELAPDQFVEGLNVKDFVAADPFGSRSKALRQSEVDEMASRMDTRWTAGLPKTPRLPRGNARQLKASFQERARVLAASQVLGAQPGAAAQRLAKLRGTDVERKLITPDVLMAHGVDPRSPVTAEVLARLNPLQRLSPESARFTQAQRRRLGAHGVDLAATLDDSILGFALSQKGVDPAVVWKKLREQVFLSTALHEVGHTLGLRHNFAGSYDPMNYPKAYWDLRTAGGTKQPKPRYLDPESDAELKGVTLPSGLRAGIAEFMQSSIMDYGANFNSDLQGLQKYDRAALLFGYGKLVEVFDDVKDPYLLGAVQAVNAYGDALPFLLDCAGNDFISLHYSKLPTVVDLEKRSVVPFAEVERKVLSPACAYPDQVEVDARSRPLVPYKFCSDEFEGASMGCEMFDRGADVYEVAAAKQHAYRNYYLFDAFRRDRLDFSPDGYLDRVYFRYFESLRTMMQFYVLNRASYADLIPDDGTPDNFWRSPDKWGPYTVAVTQGFDFFGEVLMKPEPGPYYRYSLQDGREAYLMDPNGEGAPAFRLGLDQGRYFETGWEYDSGYFWYERLHHVGSFLDKVGAISQLVDPTTYFIGKDVAVDSRQYAINYWKLYPRQVLDLFGATLTDRWDRIAPVFDGSRFAHRPISATITIPTGNAAPVDPQLGFTLQLWMASLGGALIPMTYDQTFADSTRLWLAGNGSQLATTLPTVTFADPYSGKTFTAVSYKEQIFETGIAARMISRANELKGQLDPADPSTQAALRSYVELLEAQRTISEVYGNSVY